MGLVKVRCFRPFPDEALRRALQRRRAVVVLDRALSMGFQGILAGEVKARLYDAQQHPLVLGVAGRLGGRESRLETRPTRSWNRREGCGSRAAADEVDFRGSET